MAKARIICNSRCLKCDSIEKEMVKVGPMVFCNDCFIAEFINSEVYDTTSEEVPNNCEEYKDWLACYKKYKI